jgi:hypothetical protein
MVVPRKGPQRKVISIYIEVEKGYTYTGKHI